jgi:hypothetical protein
MPPILNLDNVEQARILPVLEPAVLLGQFARRPPAHGLIQSPILVPFISLPATQRPEFLRKFARQTMVFVYLGDMLKSPNLAAA